jgi:hypothetical protein
MKIQLDKTMRDEIDKKKIMEISQNKRICNKKNDDQIQQKKIKIK